MFVISLHSLDAVGRGSTADSCGTPCGRGCGLHAGTLYPQQTLNGHTAEDDVTLDAPQSSLRHLKRRVQAESRLVELPRPQPVLLVDNKAWT